MSDYFESGFCVREPSWHGKETLLDEDQRPRTWAEARPLAGLDWEYRSEPLFQRSLVAQELSGEPLYDYREVPGHQIITRDDTGDVLHTARDSFELITLGEMGEILHTLLEQERIEFETAGSVRGGRSVWALVKLDSDRQLTSSNGRIVDPSPTRPYLSVVNHADGGACKAMATAIRIVCWNTMSAAEAQAQKDNTVATFRHTKNWREHIDAARQAVRGARGAFEEWAEIAAHLLDVPVDDVMAERFVRTFIPEPPEIDLVTERVRANIEASRVELRQVLHASRTSEGITGTAYWLVQGAAEYLDHLRPWRNQDSYVTRTVLSTNKGKGLAARMALEVAKGQ